jgi:hypothetical protein
MNERLVENIVGTHFTSHGFPEVAGVDAAIERDASTTVILRSRVVQGLRRLNPHLPDATIDAVVASLSRPPHPTLIENNRHFHVLLTDGVPVEYKDNKTGEWRRADARGADPRTARPGAAPGLPAVVRGVRRRRAREHRQESGGLSPVPRGAQGATAGYRGAGNAGDERKVM